MEIIGPYTPWEPPHEIHDNYQHWFKFGNATGKLHRDHGPAVIWSDNSKMWHKDGKFHREDGPAVIMSNGDQHWYKNDRRWREDGPAMILSNGDQHWYKNEINITNDVYTWTEQCNIDLDNMTDSDKLLLKIFISSL
jgi:hypothetical protein